MADQIEARFDALMKAASEAGVILTRLDWFKAGYHYGNQSGAKPYCWISRGGGLPQVIFDPPREIQAHAWMPLYAAPGVAPSGLPAWVDGLRDFMERNGKTTDEVGEVLVAAGFATRGVQASDAPQAWQHEDDPSRVISATQKAQAERDGGASASSVKPYSVPLFAHRVKGGSE